MSEGWQIIPLGELCGIELGKTPSRSSPKLWDQERVTSNVWLSIADLPQGMQPVAYDSREYISDEGAAKCKIVKKGTLLVSFKLTLGRLAFAGRDLYTNEAIAALTIFDESKLSRDYLYWYLTFFDWQKAAEGDHKVKGKALNKAKLKVLDVVVPPLPEQKRIIAILDEVFAQIAAAVGNVEKNRASARELFESYLNAIFTQKGQGWIETKLKNICSIKHGFAFKSRFFSEEGDYVLLTPGSFYESGGYRDQGEKTKYYVGDIPEGYLLKKGDFLFAMTEQAVGLLGSSLIVPESERFLHNQRLGLVQVADGIEWHNDFFSHQFNTKKFRAAVQESASGVKVRHTSPNKLGAVPVCFPATKAEQEELANKLNGLQIETQRLERIYQKKLAALTELKRSILQKAFTGKLTAEDVIGNKEAAA